MTYRVGVSTRQKKFLGTLYNRHVGDRYIDGGLIGPMTRVHKLAKIFHGMGSHFKNEMGLDN